MGYYLKNFAANMKSVMEYRFSFITHSVGMMLNDLVFVVFWIVVYARFGDLKGYSLNDTIILTGIVAASYGFCGIFLGNWRKIAEVIANGELDRYLTIPKNVLLNVLTTWIAFEGFGDVVFGLAIGLFLLPLYKLPLFIFFLFTGFVLLVSCMVVAGSLAFWLGRADDLANSLLGGIVHFTTYPFSLFENTIKFLFMTAIPVGFITGVPVELLKAFNWKWMIILVVYTFLFACFAYWFFNRGLKRYESGNSITVRI